MNDSSYRTTPTPPSRLLRLLPLLLVASLAACQTLKPPALPMATVTSPPASANAAPPLRFSISGKIGVRTPKQSGSAFYAWAQDGDRFAIDLTGALGIGQTHIEGIPGKVSLNSAKTGLIEAATPEELLEQATGWQAPISFLPHWIEGQAIQSSSPNTLDSSHRLLTLTEGGWDVSFEYPDTNNQLPNRLVMLQDTATADKPNSLKNRVILTVSHDEAQVSSAAP